MQIEGIRLKTVVFPGEAGEMQRRGATSSVMRALGDDYEGYHAWLAQEFTRVTPEPEPRDFNGDIEAYAAACTRFVDVLRAERVLRRCRELRKGVRSDGVPLLDDRQRLLSAVDWRPPTAERAAPPESSPRGPLMHPE